MILPAQGIELAGEGERRRAEWDSGNVPNVEWLPALQTNRWSEYAIKEADTGGPHTTVLYRNCGIAPNVEW
jgi:hypothetical protein